MEGAGLKSPIGGIRFPSGWGAISKRSVAGRVGYEVSADSPAIDTAEPETSSCKSVQYADTYLWKDADSLWVVKGSKEAHEAIAEYHKAKEPQQDYEDFIKSLGAQFYADCKFRFPFSDLVSLLEPQD